MKKIFTLVMLLAMAVTGFAGEKTVMFSPADADVADVNFIVKDGISLTLSGGFNNSNYLLANPNTNFTLLSYNRVIKKVVFNCLDDALEGDLDAGYWGPSTITLYANFTNPSAPGTYIGEGFTGTWEGESFSLSFATKGRGVRFSSIEVTFEKNEGDIYELVTQRNQIVEGSTYVIVSQYNDKVMRYKESADVTPPATPVVEWLDEGKTRVKVGDDAMIIRMMGVQDSVIGSNTRTVAWFKVGNGYLRGQGDNLTVTSTANDYGRAIMYISATENNYLCWFKNVGSSTKTIRYDYDNEQFMFKSINNDPNGRVWLYKLAESYQVNIQSQPEGTGTITLTGGVIDNKSQAGETVTFIAEPVEGYEIESINVINLTTGEELTLVDNRADELSFVMPASDVNINATFSQHTGIGRVDNAAQVTGVEYVNLAGVSSNKPFSGLNIVKTTYSDGSVVISKVVR